MTRRLGRSLLTLVVAVPPLAGCGLGSSAQRGDRLLHQVYGVDEQQQVVAGAFEPIRTFQH